MSTSENKSDTPDIKVSPIAAISDTADFFMGAGPFAWLLVFQNAFLTALIYMLGDLLGLSVFVVAIVQLCIQAVYIFTWHRYCLLGLKHNPFKRMDGPFTKFLFLSVYFYILMVLVTVVALSPGILLTPFLGLIGAILTLAAILAVFVLAVQVALIFPALATERPITWKDALAISKDHRIPMVIGYVLFAVIVGLLRVPDMVLYDSAYSEDGQVEFGILYVIYILYSATATAMSVLLWAGLNSSFYRQLTGGLGTPEIVADTDQPEED